MFRGWPVVTPIFTRGNAVGDRFRTVADARLDFLGMDTTNTITISEPPSRGLRFAIGCAILYACWANRRLIAGWLFSTVAPNAPAPDGYGSVVGVTGLLLPLAIDFVVAIGGFGIFAATFGWRIVADVVQGIYATVSNWRNAQQATARTIERIQTIGEQSRQNATRDAAAAAGRAGQAAGASITDPQLAAFAEQVRTTFVAVFELQRATESKLDQLLEKTSDRAAGERVPHEPPPPSPHAIAIDGGRP